MPFDLEEMRARVNDFYDNQPHPLAPEIKVKDYPSFARVAMMQTGQLPEPEQVLSAYHQLNNAEISPSQWERAWKNARPIANRMLGRDPDLEELKDLSNPGVHPRDFHDYYSSMPHPDYPEVRAGDMVRVFQTARPISQALKQRDPLPTEVARFAAADYGSEDIVSHYSDEW